MLTINITSGNYSWRAVQQRGDAEAFLVTESLSGSVINTYAFTERYLEREVEAAVMAGYGGADKGEGNDRALAQRNAR